MRTRRFRVALLTGLVIAVSATTDAAQADAPTAAVGAPSAVAATSATVTGAIAPGDQAVTYEFRYGASSSLEGASSAVVLPAGGTPRSVSATLRGLTPRTTYHYALFVTVDDAPSYYDTKPIQSAVGTFTTRPEAAERTGSVTLRSAAIRVRRGRAAVGLSCHSTYACVGKVVLSRISAARHASRAPARRRTATVTLGAVRVVIRTGAPVVATVRLDRTAQAALAHARSHRLRARLSATFATGQHRLARSVTLIG